ncbi:ankyrin repeat domain-containing protein [Rheinheimera maricola]|uniref:Ankyrin repeat domain-containing protein n=1 Tax=Rheinheimera maricola TaxID=2793282 RepID=A0ABS7X332_9GAMM|nr:ankyrin repeat domain-containing protein [Rheinheimera maricola]MBZ9609986.1 ankyrin repeat domain-containing protein [Rheinheimera maricola]
MGTWSNKPFGNDTALDWFSHLEESQTAQEFISSTLKTVLKKQLTDSTEEEEAIAAIAIIASASHEPVRGCSQKIKSWINLTAFSPTADLKVLAVKTLDRILAASELRDLWQEAETLVDWEKQLNSLKNDLLAHLQSDSPIRKPKKRVLPRTLTKLVDYYLKTEDQQAKLKIVEKLTRIENPNMQEKATGYELPINIAAKLGLNDVIEQLIAKGANPNLKSTYGYTPLDLAAANDHFETVALLLKNGTELFIDYPTFSENGVICQRIKCVAILSAARKASPATINLLESYGASIHEQDLNGEGLLFKAAEASNIVMLKYLISRGLDVNLVKCKTPTFQGETALHYAVRANNFEAVEVLLDSGADINAISYNLHPNNPWYETPLNFCKTKDNPELYQYLTSKGARYARELLNAGKKLP